MVDGIEWGGGGRHDSAILRGGGPYYIFLEDMFQFDMRVRMAYLPPRISTQNNINGSFTGEYEDNSPPEEPPNLLINRADSIVMLCPLTFRLHFCPCIALHMEGPKLDAPRIRRAFSPKKLSCGCLTRPISAALNYIPTDLW